MVHLEVKFTGYEYIEEGEGKKAILRRRKQQQINTNTHTIRIVQVT